MASASYHYIHGEECKGLCGGRNCPNKNSDYCNFMSNGSAREYCRFNNISQIVIDVPTIKEQNELVSQIR